MAQSSIPEIDVGKVIETIRKELERNRPVSGAPQEMAPMTFGLQPRESGGLRFVDRFLWKYGMRYARLIIRVPLLRKMALKQYMRIVSTAKQDQTLASIQANLSQAIEAAKRELKELVKQLNDHERSLLDHERSVMGLLEEARDKIREEIGKNLKINRRV